MTQRELAAALDYSDSLISSLENAQRQPDLEAVRTRLIPALGLQDEPAVAALLIERAAAARGERPPALHSYADMPPSGVTAEQGDRERPLPLPPDELLGRDTQVRQLCDRLLRNPGRLLTLVGPPGIGKTRLALALAEQLQSHFADGAVFVPLAAVHEPAQMASAIANAVTGDMAPAGPPAAVLTALLRQRRLLLVLDNCEQIAGAGALVAEVLAACSQLAVVATSRERLHLRAEQRFRVPALDLDSAVALFVHRASATDAAITVTDATRPTLEAICRLLDCLPLALELCAGQIELLGPTQLLAQLRAGRLDLLAGGPQDAPPQHRTLRDAIQRSYALLTDAERTLFRRLGVFVGGWSLDLLQAVGVRKEPQDQGGHPVVLHALVSKSLVSVKTMPDGNQRFFLLETLREFALEQAQAHAEAEQFHESHFQACLAFMRRVDPHLRGAEGAIWFARALPEQDNVRAAMHWALGKARYTDAAWLILAAGWYWVLSSQSYEAARLISRILPHRAGLEPDLRLTLLLWYYAFADNETQPPEIYNEEVRQLSEGCEHPILRSGAWHWLAVVTLDPERTIAASEQGIIQARAALQAPGPGPNYGLMADRDFLLAGNLVYYGHRLIDAGALGRAAPLVAESIRLFQAKGHLTGVADCLGALARIAQLTGDLDRARTLLDEARRHVQSLDYRRQTQRDVLMAQVTLYQGDGEEAQRLLHESLQRCLERKERSYLAQIYIYLAECSLWAGEPAQAERWFAESLFYLDDPRRVTIAQLEHLCVAARLAAALGADERAAELFGRATAVSRRLSYEPTEPVHSLNQSSLAQVRSTLGEEAFTESFARGLEQPIDAAYALLMPRSTPLSHG